MKLLKDLDKIENLERRLAITYIIAIVAILATNAVFLLITVALHALVVAHLGTAALQMSDIIHCAKTIGLVEFVVLITPLGSIAAVLLYKANKEDQK